jgi:dihydrofolate reductase
VVFLSGDLVGAVATVKMTTAKDINVFGGPTLVQSLIDVDQIDELSLSVIPVLLGEGEPFFGRLFTRKKVALKDVKRFDRSGIVILTYDMKPPAAQARPARARRTRT